MSDVFDGMNRTVETFSDDFITDDGHCEHCLRRLRFGLCEFCDPDA